MTEFNVGKLDFFVAWIHLRRFGAESGLARSDGATSLKKVCLKILEPQFTVFPSPSPSTFSSLRAEHVAGGEKSVSAGKVPTRKDLTKLRETDQQHHHGET